jgi:transitional endoplasmic reticulum ATPase
MEATDDFGRRLLALMDTGTASLRRNDRAAAARDFAEACQLLFQQAATVTSVERKLPLVQHARQLLATVQSLREQAEPATDRDAAPDTTAPKPAASARASAGMTFAEVAGLDQVKETLRLRLIYPLQHPEKLAAYGLRAGGGLLLFGPPGTGKTLIARAVAGELSLPFFAVKPSQVLSQWYGQSEAKLAALFEEARQQRPGAVLFVDEIDALGAARNQGDMSEASRRLLTQLLQELDGVGGHGSGLLFLAATNQPWSLDEALLRPGRFDEKCYVPLPDLPARRELVRLHLRGARVAGDLDLARLAARTEGYSGADLMCLCERAKQIPFREAVLQGTDRAISAADFEQALATIRPSVSAAALRQYERYGQQ